MDKVLHTLDKVIQERIAQANPEDSYVALLQHKGINHILKKLGEECGETIIAAKDAQVSGEITELIYETADLWVHSLVLLHHLGTDSSALLEELARRFNLSGLTEKKLIAINQNKR